MRTYSIKDLENLSGIKAHTIRIWEQRYELLNPSRTETGIRFYSGDDLKKILATSVLIKSDTKISKIAKFSKEELQQKITEIESNTAINDSKIELSISKLLEAGLDFDEQLFTTEFSKVEKLFDTTTIFSNIVYPLLSRIGVLWNKDEMTPIQEHFISNIVRQKLISATNSLPIPDENAQKIVLFLPEQETHEIGILLANYIFKSEKIKTFYFGQQVPVKNLIDFILEQQIKHSFGFVFFSQGVKKQTAMLSLLNEKCAETNFYWAGYIPDKSVIESFSNNTIVSSIEGIKDIILTIKK